MQFLYSPHFKKRYRKLPPKLQDNVDERLRFFKKNPFDPLLNNHALVGKWKGYRSINITGDWRAVFRLIEKQVAYFVEVGTHSELYGK